MAGPFEKMFNDVLSTLLERFGDQATDAQKTRFRTAATKLFHQADGLINIDGILQGDFSGLTRQNLTVAMYAVPKFAQEHPEELAELKNAAFEIYKTNPPQMQRALQERLLSYVKGIEPAGGRYTEFLPQSQKMLDESTRIANGLMGDMFGGQAGALAPGAEKMNDFDPAKLPGGALPDQAHPLPAAPPPPPQDRTQAEQQNANFLRVIRAASDAVRDVVRETPALGETLLGFVGLPANAEGPNVSLPAPILPKVEKVEGGIPSHPPIPKPAAPNGAGKPAQRKAG